MTFPYRYDSTEPPFGYGTFWTTWDDSDSAKFVAQVEAGTPTVPAGRVYVAEVPIGGSEARQPVDDFLPLVREKPTGEALPLLRDELVSRGERAGGEWVRFTDHGSEWKGAMLYLGDEFIAARSSPD